MEPKPKRCISFLDSPKERCREDTLKKFCSYHSKLFGIPKYKKMDDINISKVSIGELGIHKLMGLYKKIQAIVTLRQAFMEKAVCEECRDSGHLLRIKLLLDILERCDEMLESLFKSEEDEDVNLSLETELPKVKHQLVIARAKFVATKKKIEQWESLAASMIKENDHIISTLEEEATLFACINEGRLSQVYVVGHLYGSMVSSWKRKEVIRWYQKPTLDALSHREKYEILRVGIFHMGTSLNELKWNTELIKERYSFSSKVEVVNMFIKSRLKLANDILNAERVLALAKYNYDDNTFALTRQISITCLGKDWARTYSVHFYEKLVAFDWNWEDSGPKLSLDEAFQGGFPKTKFKTTRQWKEYNISYAINRMIDGITNDNADERVSKLVALINS